jgi:hypothetical protein
MLKNLFLAIILLSQVSAFASIKDYFTWANIKEKIVSEVANMDVSFDLDLIDGNIGRGVGVKTFYKYEVEPSFIQDSYLRVDRYSFNVNLNPGDIIDGISPVYFNVSKGNELYFIRNFSSQVKALTALPYSFNKLPYNAKTTLERLNTGDFVSYPATMSLSVGAKSSTPVGPIKVQGLVGMLLRGQFTINLYKVDEKHVRLKLVANTYNSGKVSVQTDTDMNITGVGIVDDKLKGIIFHDLVDIYGEKGFGEQYVIDYIFDLTNEEAAKAFDAIIKPSYKLSVKDFIGKFQGIEFFENKLISDFSLAEDLFKKGNGVERIFKGFNKYRFEKNGINIGLVISRIKKGKAYYKNKITVEDQSGELHRYFFPNRISYYEEELRVGLIERKDEFATSYHGLVSLDHDDIGKKYSDVGMSFWRDDKVLTRNEWKRIHQLILDTVPDEVSKDIDFSELLTRKRKQSTKIKIQVLFKENAFDSLKTLKLEEIQDKLHRLVRERRVIKNTFLGRFYSRTTRAVRNLLRLEQGSVNRLARNVHNILTNEEYDARKRVEKLIDMPDKFMFKRYGLKLLMELIPQERWENDLYFKLEVLGMNMKGIRYQIGDLKLSQVYKQVLRINKELHDPSKDLRLIVEK